MFTHTCYKLFILNMCLIMATIVNLTQKYRISPNKSGLSYLHQMGMVYTNLWMTSPERSLGSNHVVLGGMMLPVSAMSMSCFIDTG